jgi:hypothetical protein
MEEEERLIDLLSKGTVNEGIVALELYLERVSEGNENPRTFHRILPKLLLHVLGSEEKKGWLELFQTAKDVDALMRLLSSRGCLMRAIAWELSENNFMYEIPLSKLPPTMQDFLRYTKDLRRSGPSGHLTHGSDFRRSPFKNPRSTSPGREVSSAISERLETRPGTESVLKLSRYSSDFDNK